MFKEKFEFGKTIVADQENRPSDEKVATRGKFSFFQ